MCVRLLFSASLLPHFALKIYGDAGRNATQTNHRRQQQHIIERPAPSLRRHSACRRQYTGAACLDMMASALWLKTAPQTSALYLGEKVAMHGQFLHTKVVLCLSVSGVWQ